jgi:hypothetical protein
MSDLKLQEGTWRTGLEEDLPLRIHMAVSWPTGWERDTNWNRWLLLVAHHGGHFPLEVPAVSGPRSAQPGAPEISEPEHAPADLKSLAASLAVQMPHVASPPPRVPRLGGNLAEDVHDVTGLTWSQIGEIFKISERAATGWRVQGVPRHRQEEMEAMRAIGTILVGGLGPAGVAEWLTAGTRPRLKRLREGEVREVADEAEAYRDTPAT